MIYVVGVTFGILLLLVYAIHVYLSKTKFNYWEDLRVPAIPATPFIGVPLDNLLLRKPLAELFTNMYTMYQDSPIVGMYEGLKPVLILRDPEIIKLVTVKDFDHFTDRRVFKTQSKSSWFDDNLLSLQGQEWKDARSIITPTFTSGKMKRIFETVDVCGKNCIEQLMIKAKAGEELEFRDFVGRYTMDVIAASAFGIQCNSFKEKDPLFPKMANKLMNASTLKMIQVFLVMSFPFLARVFPTEVFDKEASDFFQTVIKEAITEREHQDVKGKDFLELLLQARKGELEEDKEHLQETKNIGLPKKDPKTAFTDMQIISHSVLFLFAGYETTGFVISFTAYELALHPEIQDKIRNELEEVLPSSGKMTYDAVQKMEYLDMVVNESMRRHTPSAALERMCTKDYHIPGTSVTVKKGHLVSIPTVGLHMDPKYYPDPEKFDPDRFSREEKAKRNPYVFMPFGIGPRNCAALRFALMEIKAVLAKILLEFKLSPCAKTEIPIKYGKGINLRPEKGIWLKVEEIKK